MIEIVYYNYKIKLGKNCKENYKLVTVSNPNDIWVHLSDYPSGHAIITNSLDKKIPFTVLKHACLLVKKHSKYKNINKIDCDIAYVKDIKIDRNSEVEVNKLLKIITI